jgi:hypothetical protein
MAAPAKTVKDVSSHEFVKEYASYLRSTGKVRSTGAFAVAGFCKGEGGRGRCERRRRRVAPPPGAQRRWLPCRNRRRWRQPLCVHTRAAHADLPLQP